MTVSLPLWVSGFVVLLGAVTDLTERRIPNWITIPAIAGGFMHHGLSAGWTQGGSTALGGLLMGGGLLLPFFLGGKMGGGDVKLLAALGAWLGGICVLNLFLFSAWAGGLWALWIILRSGRLLSSLNAIRTDFSSMCITGRFSNVAVTGITMPYAVAFVSGYLMLIVHGRLV